MDGSPAALCLSALPLPAARTSRRLSGLPTFRLSLCPILLVVQLLFSFPPVLVAFSPAPSPPVLHLYDLRYSGNLSLPFAHEEQQFVSALAGLANRHQPRLLLLLTPADDVWLSRLTAPGQWLSNSTLVRLPDLTALVQWWRPLGVALYDLSVPSTSLLALTVTGSDGLLPVAFRPSEPASLYSRLVSSGPRLPVLLSLVGLFNVSAPSPKSDAYRWLFARQLQPSPPLSEASTLGYFPDAYCATHEPHLSDPDVLVKLTAVNVDWVVAQAGLLFDLAPWADEAPIDDPTQPLGSDLASLLYLLSMAQNSTRSMVHIAGFTPWWSHSAFTQQRHAGSLSRGH